jgi:hypothetical protein
MRRISAVFAVVLAFAGAVHPCFAQEDDRPGFGALVGGLVGGAIGAAVDGRAPRAGDVVPGIGGGGKGKGGGGQHGHPGVAGEAQHAGAHPGGQAAPVRRKAGN